MFSALLNRLGIADAVITADAVHAQLGALPRREMRGHLADGHPSQPAAGSSRK